MARSKRNNKMKVAIDPAQRKSLKEVMRKLCNIPYETTEELLNAGFGSKLEKLIMRLLEGGGIPRKEPSLRPININISGPIQHFMMSPSGRNVVKYSKGHEPRLADMVVSRVASRLSELWSDPPSIEDLKDELKSLSESLESTIPHQKASENVDSADDQSSRNEFASSAPASEYQSSVAATASDPTRELLYENKSNIIYPYTEAGYLIQLNGGRSVFSSDGNISNCDPNGYDGIDIHAIDDGGKIAVGALNQPETIIISDVPINTPALVESICERFEQENAAGSDPPVAEPVEASEITESDNEKMNATCNDRSACSSHASCGDEGSFEEGLNEADSNADEEAEENGFEGRGLDRDGRVDAEADDYDNDGRHISGVTDDSEGDGNQGEMDSKEEKEKQEADREADDDDGCHISGAKDNEDDGKQKERGSKEEKIGEREWKERNNKKGQDGFQKKFRRSVKGQSDEDGRGGVEG